MTAAIDDQEQAPARRRGTWWAFGILVALAVGSLGWFSLVGSTSAVAATASSTCHGAMVSANEVRVPNFAPVRSIETQEWGEIRITRRLFQADRFEFVAPGQPVVPLQVEEPWPAGYHCPG